MKSSRQCFYLVLHDNINGGHLVDKIFLQESEALRWGRRFATKNPNLTYHLYKQEITRNATLRYVIPLLPFLTPEEAIKLASKYNLQDEVQRAMDEGMSPFDACKEWDVV